MGNGYLLWSETDFVAGAAHLPAGGPERMRAYVLEVIPIEIMDAGRDHVVVNIFRQAVGLFRLENSTHPLGDCVQIQHGNPISFLSSLYPRRVHFARRILYNLTKVFCLFSTVSSKCT